MSLLLPLCLVDDEVADVALVVELYPETKKYQGQTILTIAMAYNDARLICRPDSDWLVPGAGNADDGEDDDQDDEL